MIDEAKALLEISGAESVAEALDIFRREREANVGLASENERLREGLQWYADGNHYDREDCSGESRNWLFPPLDTTEESWLLVDDGGIARQILNGKRINPDKDADEIIIDAPLADLSPAKVEGGEGVASEPSQRDVWLIFFDDADRGPELYTDRNAAIRRYDQISVSWNATLFESIHYNGDPGSRESRPTVRVEGGEGMRAFVENATKAIVDQAQQIADLKDELAACREALRECITEDGARAWQQPEAGAAIATRRLDEINKTVRAALDAARKP